MIVECPRCNARYRVEEEVLQDDPTFKCSRCSHIFAYEADGRAESSSLEDPAPLPEPEPSRRSPARPTAESLSFSFAEASRGMAPPPPASRDAAEDPAEEFAFDREDEEEEDVAAFVDEAAEVDDQPRFVRGEDELRVEEESSSRPDRSYLVFLALLLLLYGNLALYMRNHFAESEGWLTSVPFFGRALTEDRLLQMKVQLEEVEGVYQQIKDDRVVFIVTGRAINTSGQPLKGVQIESGLYDDGGNRIESKSIYCGNAMSLKIVKDLSSKEISLLQRLEPPQRFEILPGEAAGFTVVFMQPPPALKEFSARVVAAQRAVS